MCLSVLPDTPAVSISNVKLWGLSLSPHYHHLALRIAHNVPWMNCLGVDPLNALLQYD